MAEKVLLHFREQLPQVAKSQETPSSKNGLDKGVYLDLETARFLWWHQITTKGAFSGLPSPPRGPCFKRVVVTGPRKVNGTWLSPRLPQTGARMY